MGSPGMREIASNIVKNMDDMDNLDCGGFASSIQVLQGLREAASVQEWRSELHHYDRY